MIRHFYFKFNGVLRWISLVITIIATITLYTADDLFTPNFDMKLSTIPIKAISAVYAIYFGMLTVLLWVTAPLPNPPNDIDYQDSDDADDPEDVHQRWSSFLFYLGSLICYLHFGCSNAGSMILSAEKKWEGMKTAAESSPISYSMGFLPLDVLVVAHLLYCAYSAVVFTKYYWPSLMQQSEGSLEAPPFSLSRQQQQKLVDEKSYSCKSVEKSEITAKSWLHASSDFIVWSCRIYLLGILYRIVSRSELPFPPIPAALSPLLLIWIVGMTGWAARQALRVTDKDSDSKGGTAEAWVSLSKKLHINMTTFDANS